MTSGFAIWVAVAALAVPAAAETFRDAVDGDAALRQGLGAAVGAYLERRLGRELSPDERARHDAAAVEALWNHSKGYGANWRDRDSGVSGAVEPTSKVEFQGDTPCRLFHDTVRQPGRPVFGVDGTACLSGHDWTVDY